MIVEITNYLSGTDFLIWPYRPLESSTPVLCREAADMGSDAAQRCSAVFAALPLTHHAPVVLLARGNICQYVTI